MSREEVIKYLRACLLSAKGGVKIENLNRDYKILVDENIPFRKLGYQSLLTFLHSIQDIKTVEKGGECYVEAIAKEESAHLKKLVSWQKSVPNKPRKKKVDTRRQTPFRQPMVTKRNVRSPRSGYDYSYPYTTVKPNTSFPVMPTKITIQNNEKPRYIQSVSGIPPSSPSKRLKNKQVNPLLAPNQSINKPREDPYLKNNEKLAIPVISQKPKTVNNNTEIPNKGKTTNISERLRVNPNIPPLLSLNVQNGIPVSSQSEILSPFSPAQALATGNVLQFQQKSTDLAVSLENARKIVPKPLPIVFDPRDELRARTNALNLPEPIYQILPTKIKNAKEQAVFAQVKIGPYGYASYPEEARTEDEAEKLAAKIALLDLTEKYGSLTRCTETRNANLIKERVLAIIDTHPNGIFMHQVPIYYKQKHKEVLPAHWERTIEACPAIVLEKGVDNSVILRRFISSGNKMCDVTSPKTDSIKLNPIGPVTPKQLQFPEKDYWMVSVTYVSSTVEVWGRLLEDTYSEEFDLMTSEMMEHYGRVQQPVKPSTIEIGSYYAVLEDESWHRVRCIDYDSASGSVTVSFIDHGDEDTFDYNKLQILDRKFCSLPAQAVRFSLYGLEDFGDCDSVLNQIEKELLDRAFYVEIVSRDSDQHGPFATVIFYDTHGPDDVNLNAMLSKHILQHVLVAPKLEGQVSEVFISHIEAGGNVYVQMQSESMKLLVSLLNRLIQTGLNTEDVKNNVNTIIDMNKVYFVSVNNNWFRGKVISHSLSNQLKVFLIDFGKTVTAERNNLLPLEKFSEILARYPPQALKVHLHNIDKSMMNEKMVSKLAELTPEAEPLLIKVVASSESDVPVVELFKRIQPSNMLVSINNTLALEEELTRSQGDGNNNIKPRKRIERMNSKISSHEDDDLIKSLKPPKISGLGQYFDVHVTMAAHPGNFTIQPFDDKKSLETMMIELQRVCHAYKGSAPTAESVREGKLYAAKYMDGHWYRVCISSVIKENMVSVYFCDFGDASVLPLSNLQPLQSQFLELPYQAIKARLVGIRPVNVDWSVEDSLRFQELVVDKNFVSVVVESGPDGLSPADTVLGLKLIDVDTSEDVYVHRLLVDEGRATFVDQ